LVNNIENPVSNEVLITLCLCELILANSVGHLAAMYTTPGRSLKSESEVMI